MCVYQTHISPEYLQERTNTSLLMDDEKDEKQYNEFQHMEQLLVCSEGLNHQEEDHGCEYLSFYSCLSISKSLYQEGSISLDSFEEQNNNYYFETYEENRV